MTANPADGPDPNMISRHDVGTGDVVITREDIESAIERGVLDSPAELRVKLLGSLGIHGRDVDPRDEPAELIRYDHERETSLGVMGKFEFSRTLDFEGKKAGRLWREMEEVSMRNAQTINYWEDPSTLRQKYGQLNERIPRMAESVGPHDRELQRLEDLRVEIMDRLNRQAHGIPPSVRGPVVGRPFMYVEQKGEVDDDAEPILLVDATESPRKSRTYIGMDALYDFLEMTEGADTGDLGVMRPQIISLVNSRIIKVRETRNRVAAEGASD